MKLPKSFYLGEEVVQLAKKLIGMHLYTNINGVLCGGIISETEAYEGVSDKASHAYGGRRTARTEPMFSEGGITYIYLCYGIHHLLNFVTNKMDIPHAILVRSIIPTIGSEEMMKRCKKRTIANISDGPGKLTKALGIDIVHNKLSLLGDVIWVEDKRLSEPFHIMSNPRIGVNYAGDDAKLPYRFNLIWE